MKTNIESEIKTLTEHRDKLLRTLTVVRIRYASEVARDELKEYDDCFLKIIDDALDSVGVDKKTYL